MCDASDLAAVRDAMAAAGFGAKSAELAMIPLSFTPVDGETAESVAAVIDMLEDDVDVTSVFHNASMAATDEGSEGA